MAGFVLMGGKSGATRTLTLKAFGEDEYRQIVTSLVEAARRIGVDRMRETVSALGSEVYVEGSESARKC